MSEPQFVAGETSLIRIRRRYEHPIDRVWRAVTEPTSLAQWFPAEVHFDLRNNGTVIYDPSGESPYRGTVIDIDPPRRLVFTWDADRLEFALDADGDATVFTLTHHFGDRAGAASFASGWELCLLALRSVLSGEELPSLDPRVERHEQLVALFGLDQPVVTRGADGWRASFERQLTCPAERAWDLFFGADAATGQKRSAPTVGGEFRPYGAPEVLLGVATVVDPPLEFAFGVAAGIPGDAVSVRLGEGTGHGARLLLDVTGTVDSDLEAAIDTWGRGAVEDLARQAAELGPH